MPEMGLDEEPISPVSREETVTNRNPNTTISTAPRRFMCSGGRGQDGQDQRQDAPADKFHRQITLGAEHGRGARRPP